MAGGPDKINIRFAEKEDVPSLLWMIQVIVSPFPGISNNLSLVIISCISLPSVVPRG